MTDTPSRAPRDDTVGASSSSKKQQPAAAKRELPYGGDMQAAMRAGDRDAIRELMAARDGGSSGESKPHTKKHERANDSAAGGGGGIGMNSSAASAYLSRNKKKT